MIVEEKAYDVRYSRELDGLPLRSWLEDPTVRAEFPITTEQELDLFLPNWIGFYRFKSCLTAVYEEKPVGIGTLLLMPYRKLLHHCLMYVVVDPKWQGKGVGTSLVRNLKHLAVDYFHLEMIYAELYEGCKLESILKKQGFTETLRQEKFVKDKTGYRARVVLEVDLCT